MTDKERRALIRAFKKFGTLERADEILEDAHLAHKDTKMLSAELKKMLSTCEEAVANSQEKRGMRD
jgi:hypothetical protein